MEDKIFYVESIKIKWLANIILKKQILKVLLIVL